jgi:hypothetical protein
MIATVLLLLLSVLGPAASVERVVAAGAGAVAGAGVPLVWSSTDAVCISTGLQGVSGGGNESEA